MTNHTFVLKDEKPLRSGAFENTAYADGALRLEQYAGALRRLAATPPGNFRPPRSMRWSLRGIGHARRHRGGARCARICGRAWTPGCPMAMESPVPRRASACLCSTWKTPQLIWIPTWSMYAWRKLRSAPGQPLYRRRAPFPPPYLLAASVRSTAGSGKRAKRFSTGASLFPLILSFIRDPRIGSCHL